MLVADDALHRRVMERAAEPAEHFPRRDTVDELLVIAAIAELEGAVRAPARWTPRSEEHLADFEDLRSQPPRDEAAALLRRLTGGR